ncbi:hypothetical protein EV183_004201 [Coemansia sp. RSA 2336]|nr:hypothetical protein EV183_004201 [Coemansia sp. RSA 2336]
MGPFGLPLALLTDSYKASHAAVFPDAQQATAYAEFRHSLDKQDQRMVFYGLQYIVKTYISLRWTQQDVDEAEAFFSTHNAGFTKFPFPKHLFLKFIRENQGYFPVRIEALDEGSVVYPHTPVMQITAQDEYAGLVTYLETVLLMTWYPSTVATLSRHTWTRIQAAYGKSVDSDRQWTLASRMHDFGFRACTCVEQSMLGGAAHLLTFSGSDTLSAAHYVQYRLNGGRPVATSVPATEHSVMTAHRSERQAVLRMIEEYGEGVYACVMDSFDYVEALQHVLPAVAARKLEKGGVLVIRPDSGDQVEAVLQGLRAAEHVFGACTNQKGYKVLTGVSVIQGDGVTPETLQLILDAVLAAGFSAESVGFGMGGGLLQKVNRDSMSMAVKLSSITYADGQTRDIMKFPKQGSSKTSLPGRFSVHADPAQNGAPVAYRCGHAPSSANLLKVVYDCGPVEGAWDSFDKVQERLNDQWARFPPTASALSNDLLQHQAHVHDLQEARVADSSSKCALNDGSLFEQVSLEDPLDQLLSGSDARPRRQVLDDFNATYSYDLLNQYVAGAQWRSLALASASTIVKTPANQPAALLKLWTYRTLALCNLKQFTAASRELHKLQQCGAAKWPFELRILRALLPARAHQDWLLTVERLSALTRACQRRSHDPLYRERTFRLQLLTIGACLRLKGGTELALSMLNRLLASCADDPRVVSGAARIYLQLGCLEQANRLFANVEALVLDKDDKLLLMNRAFGAVAAGKWEHAKQLFASVVDLSGDQPVDADRISAANNLALCELYLGNPQAMLNMLQHLMVSLPAAAGTSEELVFNYCTGLDLHYDGAKLRDAKAKKISEVAIWAGDGFDTASFKL